MILALQTQSCEGSEIQHSELPAPVISFEKWPCISVLKNSVEDCKTLQNTVIWKVKRRIDEYASVTLENYKLKGPFRHRCEYIFSCLSTYD